MKQQKPEKKSSCKRYKITWWQFLLIWAVIAGIAVMWDGKFEKPTYETWVKCDTLGNRIPTGEERIDPTQNAFYCGGEFYADVEQKVVYRTSSQKYAEYLALKNGNNLHNLINIS